MSQTDDLARLEELAVQYFASPMAAEHLDVWFRLYERFPEDEGAHAFWSILHGIETQEGWFPLVVASVRRQPSYFPVMMINRLLNAGITHVENTDLLGLLQAIAEDETSLPMIRRAANRFLLHQRSRA